MKYLKRRMYERHQPDKRAEKSPKTPMGLRREMPAPGDGLQLAKQ